MTPTYDTYPGVDENNEFPPVIRQKIIESTELQAKIAPFISKTLVDSWLKNSSDPLTNLENIALLCDFPVRENGETLWPQGVSINRDENEIYVSNQSGTTLRIDIRDLTTGVRKSSRTIITEDQSWSEGIPWFYNANNDLCFVIRPKGGTPAQSSFYSIYNYTTDVIGSPVAILGGVRSDLDGDFFVTSDAWTRTVSNFYIYDWTSIKNGVPTLLATVPANGGLYNTAAKNQGLAYVNGNFFLVEGEQTENPTFMAWNSSGQLALTKQFSRAAFMSLVNKLKPGLLTNASYLYETEGATNLDGKLVSVQIVNNTPAVAANGRVLVLQHNRIDGVRGIMQPVPSYIYDTGWIPMTLESGWTAANGALAPAYRREGNTVKIQGSILNTTASNTFTKFATLPAGFKPKGIVPFGRTANTTTIISGRANADGTLESWSSAATTAWRTIDASWDVYA
ncbi:minor tail protein [Arthrobacter phage Hankly]|nr:minor tail protein [Arthrobacter phage Hankly]